MDAGEESVGWLVLAGVNVVVGLVTVFSNSLVLQYYRPRPAQPTTHFLFFLLSLSDLLAGVSALLHCGVLLIYHADCSWDTAPTEFPPTSPPLSTSIPPSVTILTKQSVYCLVTYFVTQFSKHLSVFMNLLLSFIRTQHVLWPARGVNARPLALGAGVFSVLTAVFLGGVLYFYVIILQETSRGDTVQLIFTRCFTQIFLAYVMVLEYLHPRIDETLINALVIIVPYLVPSLLCLLCCCVFVWSLCSKPALSDRVYKRNRHIVVTVLILTLLFTISCSTLTLVWFYFDKFGGSLSSRSSAKLVQYTVYNLLPILNSALNPLVLIARGTTLRNHVLSWTRSLTQRSVLRTTVLSRARDVTFNNKLAVSAT